MRPPVKKAVLLHCIVSLGLAAQAAQAATFTTPTGSTLPSAESAAFTPPLLVAQSSTGQSFQAFPPPNSQGQVSQPIQQQPQQYQQSPQYQGSVQQSTEYAAPSQPSYNAPTSFVPPGQYIQQNTTPGFAMQQNPMPGSAQQTSMPGFASMPVPGNSMLNTGSTMMQGNVVVVPAGTQFKAKLINTLDSASTQQGEQVSAKISAALVYNGTIVAPSGSTLIGQVTSVQAAHKFRGPGKLTIKFTQIQTSDGRRIPLSASINQSQLKMQGTYTRTNGGRPVMMPQQQVVVPNGYGGYSTVPAGYGAMPMGGMPLGSMPMGGMPVAAVPVGGVGGAMAGMSSLIGALHSNGPQSKATDVKIKAGTELPLALDTAMVLNGLGGTTAPQAAYAPPQNRRRRLPQQQQQGYPLQQQQQNFPTQQQGFPQQMPYQQQPGFMQQQ
jgi:hypothetical protein